MLTAIRELAEEAEAGGDLAAVVARGDDCVARTRELLPGARRGGRRRRRRRRARRDRPRHRGGARGRAAARAAPAVESAAAERRVDPPAALASSSTARRSSSRASGSTPTSSSAELEPLGDSLLVVGDPTALKVHVHTDDPGRALSLGVARGTIAGVEIANMHAQTLERERRLLHAVPERRGRPCALVAVAAGAGNRRLFESLGAHVVDGGRTMNPSTAELLAARRGERRARGDPAPERPRTSSSPPSTRPRRRRVPVSVVPTTTLQAGLAAALAFDPALGARRERRGDGAGGRRRRDRGGHDRLARRARRTGSRSARAPGSASPTGVPVAGGESFDEVARAVVERLLEQPRGILTLLTGEEPAAARRPARASSPRRIPRLELEVHEGGQPHYALLLARRVDLPKLAVARSRRPRRGQPPLPRDARAAARAARRDRGGRLGRRRRRGGRGLRRARARTSS